jgi:hypothetical protein
MLDDSLASHSLFHFVQKVRRLQSVFFGYVYPNVFSWLHQCLALCMCLLSTSSILEPLLSCALGTRTQRFLLVSPESRFLHASALEGQHAGPTLIMNFEHVYPDTLLVFSMSRPLLPTRHSCQGTPPPMKPSFSEELRNEVSPGGDMA